MSGTMRVVRGQMMADYRVKDIDQNCNAPQPKTDRFCVRCQRDIKPKSPARMVHLVDGGPFALHPDDEPIYETTGDKAGDLGAWLLGIDCARIIGMEWSNPQ